MIQLGDKVRRRVNLYDQERGPHPQTVTVEATVVYIHPQRRFVTLEYQCPGGHVYRESEFITT